MRQIESQNQRQKKNGAYAEPVGIDPKVIDVLCERHDHLPL